MGRMKWIAVAILSAGLVVCPAGIKKEAAESPFNPAASLGAVTEPSGE